MRRLHLKPEAEGKGFYYLDHVPTGKVFTGTAKNIRVEVFALIKTLEDKTCRNKVLKRLFESEPDFQVRFTLTRSIPEAKLLEKEFRTMRPDYLLIN